MSCGVALGEKWESCPLEVAQGVHGFHPQGVLFGAALEQLKEQSRTACDGSLLSSWTQSELEELISLFLVGLGVQNRANLGAAGMMCCVDGGCWLLPTALLPGLLHQLHRFSPDPVLCASYSN